VGRNNRTTRALSAELSVPGTTDPDRIDPTADAYLLAVPDDAIAAVARQLTGVLSPHALVLHTSGATPTAPLAAFFERAGVFYPLQSFNRTQPLDWAQVPILYFTLDPADEAACAELAAALSPRTARVDDEQRAQLHVAAVFANNFTNHLFDIAYRIAADASLDFDLLLPLIRRTVARLDGTTPPAEWQTGPAVRGDRATIERHLWALSDHPEWQQLYTLLTELIANRQTP
jgi:predicted short-subunit dehydrogenase-like oxidoreductase (DUF2520 family)